MISLLLVVGIAACGTESATAPTGGQPADTIYDFPIVFYQGQDVVGGENLALSDLRGQPVVLNFWAGLCPPCRAEMPEFQHFADDYAGRALVVGVDLGQFFSLGSQEDAMKLLNELEVSYPAGYTADTDVIRELGVLGLPATFFVNSDGSLHRKWQGVLNTEKLTEITDEMLTQ
ncbi:MAG: TlpA disulfide reductase family protein [Chloroflexi bacterium]|nr:TlpA disulfide reductase family protein [Chloroflexota bacterium]